MRPNKLVAVLALCTAGLLSGCAGLQPGVAARVGEETISVRDVNRITDGYCQAYERQLQGDGDTLTMEFLSSNILFRLALSSAARQLADDYGVEPTAAYVDNLATLKQTVSVLKPQAAEARLAVDSSGTYVSDVLSTIGRQQLVEDGVAEPTTDDSLARGQDVMKRWLSDNEPEIDPQYGLVVDDLAPAFVDTSTSFAASDQAVAGAVRQPDPSYAASLPDSQRCG